MKKELKQLLKKLGRLKVSYGNFVCSKVDVMNASFYFEIGQPFPSAKNIFKKTFMIYQLIIN
jgi:hypothetical protein